jgi:DNA-binding NarL/FixJ family response regulator
MRSIPLKIILIEPDPIFRLGLRVSLETIPYLQIIADVATDTAALKILQETAAFDSNSVNLIVLELGNGRTQQSQRQSLQFCQQLKNLYPNLPILLLSSLTESKLLSAAKATGIEGYCPKGTDTEELVTIIQEVAHGNRVWVGDNPSSNSSLSPLPFAQLRHNLRFSSLGYIDTKLQAVTQQLQIPGIPLLEKAVLAGQQRELLTARWLLNHILLTRQERQALQPTYRIPAPVVATQTIVNTPDLSLMSARTPQLSLNNLQSTLLTSCIQKLQLPLQNLTEVPLEIDILREDKKRELLYIIIQNFEREMDRLRTINLEIQSIDTQIDWMLINIWKLSVADFFANSNKIKIAEKTIEIADFLLSKLSNPELQIIEKIPLVEELINYLLFQQDLNVDNNYYKAGSKEAHDQASVILENLLIQIGNCIVQPLLNYLADIETIKKEFYDRQIISTREIEKFRNSLSWKYRLNNSVAEPQAIFESRYDLFVFAPRGLAKISVYAPRNQELAQLSGIPLGVTLVLEFRDAIAPRLQSLLALLGNGIVFILTQVVGRGIGLIGRGILQGIGSASFIDQKLRRNDERKQ